jgi:TldD protein
MVSITRRRFLKTGVGAMAVTAIPPHRTSDQSVADVLDAGDLRALTSIALEEAKRSGASYADVHVLVRRTEGWSFPGSPFLAMAAGISVRALSGGVWGFAALSGSATEDIAARMGRAAAGQARIASQGTSQRLELAPIPSAAGGRWTTPIAIDPFTLSFEEKADFFAGMSNFIRRRQWGIGTRGSFQFLKEERTFASTDGAFTNQTVHTTAGSLFVDVPPDWRNESIGGRSANFLSAAGAGWEYIRTAPWQDRADQLIEEARRGRRKKPVDIGRYDIVFDAQALGNVLCVTIGSATALERVLGYRANEGGTSFLTDPLAMLGNFQLGSRLLSVTANRSMPGGVATVKWDEDGVEPTDATLVKEGILHDFQSTRETACSIAPYYERLGKPVRSNGCAGQSTPTAPITQVRPNLVLAAGASDTSFEDLIKDTKRGLAVIGGSASTDYQSSSGSGRGAVVHEIVDGKLGTAVEGVQYVYRTQEFWNNVVALGGPKSARSYGHADAGSAYTVTSVPGKVSRVAVVNPAANRRIG